VIYATFGINIREKRHILHKNPPQNTFTKKHANALLPMEQDISGHRYLFIVIDYPNDLCVNTHDLLLIWSKTNIKSYYGGKMFQR
jgi:hypothetical protein